MVRTRAQVTAAEQSHLSNAHHIKVECVVTFNGSHQIVATMLMEGHQTFMRIRKPSQALHFSPFISTVSHSLQHMHRSIYMHKMGMRKIISPSSASLQSSQLAMCSNCHCRPAAAAKGLCGFSDWCSSCDVSLHASQYAQADPAA